MTGAYPMWWLALPVLLLPLWWHRQKRRRTQAEPLATARFLPAAPPRQMRIWRWDDVPLLVLRCLLLLALIAWLAAVALPWRGDTAFVGRGVPDAWMERQVAQAGMAGAQRMDLPDDVLPWLQRHEHAWRKDARLLVLARQAPLPAQLPKLAHGVDIRIAPQEAAAPDPAGTSAGAGAPQAAAGSHGVVTVASAGQPPGAAWRPATEATRSELASPPSATRQGAGNGQGAPLALPVVLVAPPERKEAWRALFAAFDAAGDGKVRHVLTESDGAGAAPRASLIVWDRAAPPPANWQAPLWWLPPQALPLVPGVDQAAVQPLRVAELPLQVADSARGRLWASDAWPPKDADTARVLYETWHALHFQPEAWPLAAQVLPPQRTSPLAMPGARPDAWLAYLLLALFMLERLMTHVRRR